MIVGNRTFITYKEHHGYDGKVLIAVDRDSPSENAGIEILT